jgi:predicted nucleic acid-binding protein
MRIIISDTSCLIDLKKASLIWAFLQIPYEIVIPDVLFEEELLSFTQDDKTLLREGLKILSLSGKKIIRVQSVARSNPKLTINDCFAFVLAESIQNSILLTGDGGLRALATISKIEVHGLLWALDEMYNSSIIAPDVIYKALLEFDADRKVRLPSKEVKRSLEKYRLLLE